MSSHNQRAQGRKLRNMAILWVAGSLVIAVVAGFIVFKALTADKGEPTPETQAETIATQAAPSPSPTELAPAQIVTIGPETSELTGEPTSAPEGETAVPTAVAFVPLDSFGYGVQVHGSVGDPADTIGSVNRLGVGWIKQQVRWGDLELSPGDLNWGMIDGIIDAANDNGVRVMLSVVTAPAWTRPNSGDTHGPPEDLNQYTAFLSKLLDHYAGKVHAIEVWNEQNLEREWKSANGLVAADYVQMLQMAYETIKAKDPNIIVISGALAPTGGWTEPDGRVTAIDDFGFFQQELEAGLLNYADCVGAHHNGYNIGPDVSAEDAPNDPQAATATFRGPFDNVHHSWSFKTTLNSYYQMMNGQKKLCVTEFGWATSEGVGGTPEGFTFADDNTLQEQAEWIVQGFQLQRDWDITWLAFLWNLDYGPKGLSPQDDNVPYSILTYPDGAPRPAFEALEAMPKP